MKHNFTKIRVISCAKETNVPNYGYRLENSFMKDLGVNIVTCIHITRQRLGKYIPAKRTLATEERSLLDNGLVNTPP
jgi:hypothetical protein